MRRVNKEPEIGQRFGRLTILVAVPYPSTRRRYFMCRCDCGQQRRVDLSKLVSGLTKSCGCLAKELAAKRFVGKEYGLKHGCARDSGVAGAYQSWCSMKQRCENPKCPAFKWYGARGISVCERWGKFENFLEDMGHRGKDQSIDRFPDKNGNYEPGNCRWATVKEQMNNTRSNINVTMRGKTMTLAQWCEELGLKFNTILCRLRRGWTAEKALMEPIGEWHRDRYRQEAS